MILENLFKRVFLRRRHEPPRLPGYPLAHDAQAAEVIALGEVRPDEFRPVLAVHHSLADRPAVRELNDLLLARYRFQHGGSAEPGPVVVNAEPPQRRAYGLAVDPPAEERAAILRADSDDLHLGAVQPVPYREHGPRYEVVCVLAVLGEFLRLPVPEPLRLVLADLLVIRFVLQRLLVGDPLCRRVYAYEFVLVVRQPGLRVSDRRVGLPGRRDVPGALHDKVPRLGSIHFRKRHGRLPREALQPDIARLGPVLAFIDYFLRLRLHAVGLEHLRASVIFPGLYRFFYFEVYHVGELVEHGVLRVIGQREQAVQELADARQL